MKLSVLWQMDFLVAKGKTELWMEDRGHRNTRAESSFLGRSKHLLIQYLVSVQIRIIKL